MGGDVAGDDEIYAAVQRADNRYLLGRLDFDAEGDLFTSGDDDPVVAFTGRARLPELLIDRLPGYGTQYPIGCERVMVDLDDSDPIRLTVLPGSLEQVIRLTHALPQRRGRCWITGIGENNAVISEVYKYAAELEQAEVGKFAVLNVQVVAAVSESELGSNTRRDF